MFETNSIEYKLELTNDLDIEKEVIAFLNYHEGGIIYFGIDKNGTIAGVEDADSDMLKIKDRIKNNILPSFSFYWFVISLVCALQVLVNIPLQ